MSVLSFACAQKGFGLFSAGRKELLRAVEGHPFESFEYARGGLTVRCEVEYSGYRRLSGGSLFPDLEDEAGRSCRISFSIRKDG